MFKSMRVFAIAAALAMVAQVSQADNGCYSEGVRVGTVQKFSRKGYINKSWEGELVMQGDKIGTTKNGAIRGGNVWSFSVLDPEVAKTIDQAVMDGNPVALRYCQIKFQLFAADTEYRIMQAVERKQ
jgi:hypothetical protein